MKTRGHEEQPLGFALAAAALSEGEGVSVVKKGFAP
jgi:hypothetical protein